MGDTLEFGTVCRPSELQSLRDRFGAITQRLYGPIWFRFAKTGDLNLIAMSELEKSLARATLDLRICWKCKRAVVFRGSPKRDFPEHQAVRLTIITANKSVV